MLDTNSQQQSSRGGTSIGSGIYVDVENLEPDTQNLVTDLLQSWPVGVPEPSKLTLFVRADHVELWRAWAEHSFGHLGVAVKGTQHFSLSGSKNSADIAIATNAIADLIAKRISHVVVFSDDSDFISLYAAIREEPQRTWTERDVPFLWVVTGREGTLSGTVKRFFPNRKLHIMARQDVNESDADPDDVHSIWHEVAQLVLEKVPIGAFKSTDCQQLIKEHWPSHQLSNATGARFGVDFKNRVWPVLERMGVQIKNPGKKPIQYEMTAAAKKSAGTRD